MVSLLISLLIVLLICSVAWWAIQQIALPAPVRTAVVVIFAIILIIILLQFLPGTGFHGL